MASLNADMERRCVELLTLTGHESVVDDIPVAVIAVDSVEVLPFARVAWEFADAEGEGFESIEDWRSGHLGFWPGRGRIGRDVDRLPAHALPPRRKRGAVGVDSTRDCEMFLLRLASDADAQHFRQVAS
jgi:hypothetical protein